MTGLVNGRPPSNDLVRAIAPGVELRRDSADDEAMPTMVGHFAVFNEWAEINSVYEGHFLERFVAGAFKKTFAENRDRMQVLFDHGQDPSIGKKVLGSIQRLEEDEIGAAYEVPLLATSYNRDLLPGLESGLYGASFRFGIVREDYVARPRRAAHNPTGLPERSVTEAMVREFGPVTFPAYAGASSGVRSLTDEFLVGRLAEDPERLEQLLGRSHISLNGLRSDQPSTSSTTKPAGMVELRREIHYSRAVDYISGSAWAMHPAALELILQIVGERAGGRRPTAEEIRERIGTRDTPAEPKTGPVAVIPLVGPIIPRASLLSEMSGATSVQTFQARFREALASADVTAIVIDVDSPGGAVDQIPELAAEILKARGSKPIVAVANAWAASGAYWIASAADEIVVTPSGEVGSIGVYTAHDDLTGMQEKLGVKTTLISAGKYKVEGNPFEPLTDEAKAEIQSKVDGYYEMFIKAVARGRGVPAKTVERDFGQGRMLMAADAVDAGMADRVATLDETIARLAKTPPADQPRATEPEPPAATTPTPEPERSDATTPHAADGRTQRFTTREEYLAWISRT